MNSNWHVWRWKEEAMLCKIHTQDFKSHFWQDFLASNRLYCVHLASQRAFGDGMCWLLVQQFLTTKSPENYVFRIHFSIWPYPSKIMEEKHTPYFQIKSNNQIKSIFIIHQYTKHKNLNFSFDTWAQDSR